MKRHLENEQRSRDAAAKKRVNTNGVGKTNINYEDRQWNLRIYSRCVENFDDVPYSEVEL